MRICCVQEVTQIIRGPAGHVPRIINPAVADKLARDREFRTFGWRRQGICAGHEDVRADDVQRAEHGTQALVLLKLDHHLPGYLGSIGAAGYQADDAHWLISEGFVKERAAPRIVGQG
jgi:hypothetical protein